MNLLRLRDESNPLYDILLEYPDSLTSLQAVDIVDAAVRKVKVANPEEFLFCDLVEELAPSGISQVVAVSATESW